MGILKEAIHEALKKRADRDGREMSEEEVGDFLNEAIPKLSADLLKRLRQDAPDMLLYRHQSEKEYESRLVNRWQDGLDLLKMLYVICVEAGEMFNKEYRHTASKNEDCKFAAEVRLHARACLIFSEIQCLLEHGYADGALARWRALHEVATVAMFLAENEQEVSERFLRHRNIECWKSMEVYQRDASRLGLVPFRQEDEETANTECKQLIQKYGKQYENDYGWVPDVLIPGRVTFRTIEQRVGLNHLRPYYKWACEKIHANSNTLYSSLGLLDTEEIMLAGPSDMGLADPAQLGAISLVQATSALECVYNDPDMRIAAKISCEVSNDACQTFVAIQSALKQETRERHEGDSSL